MFVKLFFALLCFQVKTGYLLKCWDCNSDSYSGCADPFNNATLPYADCDLVSPPPNLKNVTAVACKKVHQIDNGVPVIVRSCSYQKEHNLTTCAEESFLPPNVTVTSCHVCDKNNCNAASDISPRLLLIVSIVTFTYLFMSKTL